MMENGDREDLVDIQCLYRGKENPGKTTKSGDQVYNCQRHGICASSNEVIEIANCRTCREYLRPDSPELAKRYDDPLRITDATRGDTEALRGMLKGRPTFLVCGGPSAKTTPLDLLNQRGIWSMAVNNMAGYFRPNAFVCADPPRKFHHGIWLDPTIMKFIPTPKLDTSDKRGKLREKIASGEFVDLTWNGNPVFTINSPNTWGFERRSWLRPDDSFFTEASAPWGNHNAGVKMTGERKTVCTMLCAIRILYYLGSRKIYLVGVDFGMRYDRSLVDNYAFGENRDFDAIITNNAQFEVVQGWLQKLADGKVFDRFGLEIYNCNEKSSLRTFPHVPFDLAVEDVLHGFPKEPFDLNGWYE